MSDEDVTISISREDADVLYRILTQLGHGEIKSFEAECKSCGRKINMMSNDGGETWKPTSRKTGKIHRCKEYLRTTRKHRDEE